MCVVSKGLHTQLNDLMYWFLNFLYVLIFAWKLFSSRISDQKKNKKSILSGILFLTCRSLCVHRSRQLLLMVSD